MKKKQNEKVQELKDQGRHFLKKTLVKLYLKSPPKVQYALAKYGIRVMVKKKKEDLEELIRH